MNIRGKSRMENTMGWEYKDGIVVVYIKDSLKMGRETEREYTI